MFLFTVLRGCFGFIFGEKERGGFRTTLYSRYYHLVYWKNEPLHRHPTSHPLHTHTTTLGIAWIFWSKFRSVILRSFRWRCFLFLFFFWETRVVHLRRLNQGIIHLGRGFWEQWGVGVRRCVSTTRASAPGAPPRGLRPPGSRGRVRLASRPIHQNRRCKFVPLLTKKINTARSVPDFYFMTVSNYRLP